LALEEIVYPESDGKPMAENTIQYRWLTRIKGGLEARFKDAPEVFVAGDLFWYPVKGQSQIHQAPEEPFQDYEDLYTERDAERAAKEAERVAKEAERAAKEAERAAKEAAWAKLRELGIDPEKL
jgi:hypothetical protein